MNFKIAMRVELSIKNGFTASLTFNLLDKNYIMFEIYNLTFENLNSIADICKNNSSAVIHSKNEKLSKLARFKLKYHVDMPIKILDRLDAEDIAFYVDDDNILYKGCKNVVV